MEDRERKEGSMKMKKRIPLIMALAALAGMIALNVWVKAPEREPDVVHPFANARVTWEQTFHSGAWNSD